MPRTRDLDGLARFYPPGVRPYTVKLQRGEGRPYSAPNLDSIANAQAHLGGGGLDFECDRLRIVVRDLEGTFNRLGEWSWRGERRAGRQNAGSEYTEQARTRTRASVSVQQERLEEQGDALLNPRTLLGLSETDILAGAGARRGEGEECGRDREGNRESKRAQRAAVDDGAPVDAHSFQPMLACRLASACLAHSYSGFVSPTPGTPNPSRFVLPRTPARAAAPSEQTAHACGTRGAAALSVHAHSSIRRT